MATALAGGQAIGQYDVCVMRVGRLGADCAPVYGANGGIITMALVDATASPELRTGEPAELENGCGEFLVNVQRQDKVKSRTLSGTLGLFDWEMFEIMFGGSLVIGAAGTDYSGEVIGWAEPGPDSADRNPVVVEFIVKNAAKGLGACQTPGSTTDYPAYTGYIFPKCTLTLGERAFAKGVHTVTFTGKSEPNPNFGSGPWRDWDNMAGVGTFPTGSPMVTVSYDVLPLNGLSAADVGFVSTPAAS